jgi:outer membrane protein assembly factor BamA
MTFIGGTNSLRGWRPRTIGPGSFVDSTKKYGLERAGNIILLANLELRFKIINKLLEGALFMDGGNIWLIKTRAQSGSAKILNLEKIIPEFAINTGVGARIDFQFFMLRIDWGLQLRNPEKPLGHRAVWKDFGSKDYFNNYSVVSVGLGYPF